MIKKLKLHNFQCYNDIDISFKKGVNVIVGDSHTGKTSLLRSLYWCLFNQPSGDSMRKHGTPETSVSLLFDNYDESIERYKSDKQNKYIISIGKKQTEFNALGLGKVPCEISNIHNIKQINIQKQMDSPFLLSQSSGEVMRQINKICNLEDMDLYIQNGNQNIREITQNIKNTEKQIQETKEILKQYTGLKEQKKKLVTLKKQAMITNDNNDKLFLLSDILNTCKHKQESLKNLHGIEGRLCILVKQKKHLSNYNTLSNKKTNIEDIIKTLKNIYKEQEKYVHLSDEKEQIHILKHKIEFLTDKQNKINLLKSIVTTCCNIEENVDAINVDLAIEKKNIKSIRKELKGVTCPTCKQVINPNLF